MSAVPSSSTVRLRAARGVDVPTLVALDEQLFGEAAWGEASWWAELARRPRRYYVVAERAGQDAVAAVSARQDIVGYAGCDLGGSSADVMTVATHPQVRGQGVGDLLVGRLAHVAASAGASALLLEVRADNAPAMRLYARHDFEEIARRPRYYQPDDVDAVVMRKLLDAHDVATSPAGAPGTAPGPGDGHRGGETR